MPSAYVHGHHASVLRSHSWRTVENSCPHLLPYLKVPTLHILDVGCGPGTISTDLATRVPDGFVLGIDPSAEVIEKARKHAEEKGVKNIRFEVGDIFNWDQITGIEEGSFDVVHAHQVLQHLEEPVRAMKEFIKLAKVDGLVALREADFSAMHHYPDHPGIQKWKDLYLTVTKGLGFDPTIGKRLHAVAMEAGFPRNDIDATVGTWLFSTPEEREFWCGLWAERTVKSDFRDRVVDGGYGTEADLEEIAQSWKEMEKKEDGWLLVIHGEVICRKTP
ncbi:methyltransferase UbiE [Periconia macrospinosa]|uniref:Methyltransferase UbiE n=1 Tax=Periconia macrospinosa TaxID=97972 RepID=A0A2V1E7T8_9PLEO|nr:methyltransferase UbiE [Periconia macrospinosa]